MGDEGDADFAALGGAKGEAQLGGGAHSPVGGGVGLHIQAGEGLELAPETWSKVTLEPASAVMRGSLRVFPFSARNCFPKARKIAYMGRS